MIKSPSSPATAGPRKSVTTTITTTAATTNPKFRSNPIRTRPEPDQQAAMRTRDLRGQVAAPGLRRRSEMAIKSRCTISRETILSSRLKTTLKNLSCFLQSLVSFYILDSNFVKSLQIYFSLRFFIITLICRIFYFVLVSKI